MTTLYFGWQDSHPKTTDAMRLEQAAQRFSEKHGKAAVNAVVHVSQMPITMPLACAGMVVVAEAWAARNQVYLELEAAQMRLSNEAIDVLARATVDGQVVYLPEGQLDRPLYVEVNKALEAIGGKWNRKAKGHVFTSDPEAALERIIATGEAVNKKQVFGFFRTPPLLADRVMDIADVQPHHRVLEPSAGDGALVDRLLYRKVDADNILAFEIQPDLAKEMARSGITCTCADFLQFETAEPAFDRVTMNPPFDRRMVDIDHVTHAFKWLVPGGRLVSIMSNGVTFRQDRKAVEFREFVAANNGRFHEVEDGAFKESGTMVRTVIVELERAA